MSNTDNRHVSASSVFVAGVLIGVACYLLAESLTPKNVASPGDHDVLLAQRLGFFYTPVVGLWLGWLQKSWRRALLSAGVGIAVGFIYMALCATRNFLAIMVGFPCLLGGLLAAAAGSNRSAWLRQIAARFGKGIFAGFVLGLVYMLTLNIAGGMVAPIPLLGADVTQAYINMMWRTGPIALGLASGMFFLLLRWSVGLVRLRPIFEETPPNAA
jgi:MFS family permease